MGRNKKDAAQDVLTLYNQMQEDEALRVARKKSTLPSMRLSQQRKPFLQ